MDIGGALSIIQGASGIAHSLFGKTSKTTVLGALGDQDIFSGQRYVIGIQQIRMLQREYEETGVIHFRPLEFSDDVRFIFIDPTYTLNGGTIQFAVLVGDEWKPIEPLDSGAPNSVVAIQNPRAVQLKAELTRGEDATKSPVIYKIRVYGEKG